MSNRWPTMAPRRRQLVQALGLMVCCLLVLAAAAAVRDTTVYDCVWKGKSKAEAKDHLQQLLRRWQPPSRQLTTSCADPSVRFHGVWIGGGDPGSCLLIRPTGEGRYFIRLLAESHDTIWKLKREGVVRSGTLQLNGPVMDADVEGFDVLLAVRGERLVSGSKTAEVTRFLANHGCDGLGEPLFPGALWQRASADAEAWCREEWAQELSVE